MREVSAREAKGIAAEAALVAETLQAETVAAFQKLFAGAGTRDDAAIVKDYLRKWCGADPRAPVPVFDPVSQRTTDYNLGRLAAWQHIEFVLTQDLESEGDEARLRQDTRRRSARRRGAAAAGGAPEPETPEGDGDG